MQIESLNQFEKLDLSYNDIHVWVVALEQLFSDVEDFQSTLSSDEIKQADRYYFSEARKRFIIIRGFLRKILGLYLDTSPRQIKFNYGVYGKPYLHAYREKNQIHFNLSHAENVAIYCIARSRQVGVDVECIRVIPEAVQLMDRFFCPQEKTHLQKLSEEEFSKAFFRYWTRKEAFIKARGQGLSLPLDRFDVSSISKTKELRFIEDSGDVSYWSFHELFPQPDYIASIVVEGSHPHISCWQWIC